MKCINDELIQKYIDGETHAPETESIEKHVEKCPLCAHRIEEQRVFAGNIKSTLNSWRTNPVAIPEFVTPAAPKRRLIIKTKYYIYTASVAAACVIFLALFLLPRENETIEYQMVYYFDGDFDSNRTFSQQEMTIKIFDANGKIIELN